MSLYSHNSTRKRSSLDLLSGRTQANRIGRNGGSNSMCNVSQPAQPNQPFYHQSYLNLEPSSFLVNQLVLTMPTVSNSQSFLPLEETFECFNQNYAESYKAVVNLPVTKKVATYADDFYHGRQKAQSDIQRVYGIRQMEYEAIMQIRDENIFRSKSAEFSSFWGVSCEDNRHNFFVPEVHTQIQIAPRHENLKNDKSVETSVAETTIDIRNKIDHDDFTDVNGENQIDEFLNESKSEQVQAIEQKPRYSEKSSTESRQSIQLVEGEILESSSNMLPTYESDSFDGTIQRECSKKLKHKLELRIKLKQYLRQLEQQSTLFAMIWHFIFPKTNMNPDNDLENVLHLWILFNQNSAQNLNLQDEIMRYLWRLNKKYKTITLFKGWRMLRIEVEGNHDFY